MSHDGGYERAGAGRAVGMTQPGRVGGGAMAEPVEPLQVGDPTVVGRYVLDSRLGGGGMGTVYLARDTLGRAVAVKMIRPELAADHDFRERFRHEVAAARRVSPFCTASVLDADPDAYPPYLVTEYIEGRRLDRVVMEDGPLPASTLTGTAIGVATALTAIHRAGIVHRDLKPANVILSLSGPRVIDFGIAKAAGAARHDLDRGLIFGTEGWMAPEQILGHPVGPAADVFTWGLLVAYAGTGRHPFTEPGRFGPAADADLGQRIVGAPPDLAGLAGPLRRLVEIALTKDPSARPAARDLLLRLVDGNSDVNASTPIDQVLGRTQQMAAVPMPTRVGGPAFPTGYPPTGYPPAGGTSPEWYSPAGPPQPGRPSQPGSPPRRRFPGRWLLAAAVVLVLLLLGWVVVRNLGKQTPGGDAVPSGPSVTASPSPKVGVGATARDGQLEFTVRSVTCDVPELKIGFVSKHPDGQYCLIGITASNIGDSTRNLSFGSQRLLDSAGSKHDAEKFLSGLVYPKDALWGNISPGKTVSGNLIFDIPAGTTADHLELHDGPLSDGVVLGLR